jgi:uncharacterized cupredoxin-like copper-binding protein
VIHYINTFLKCEAGAVVTTSSGVFFAITDAVAISIVTSISSVILGIVAAYLAYRAKTTSEETHKIVNSENDKWKIMAEKFFRGEGAAQEKKEQVIRESAAVIATAKGVAQEQVAEQNRQMPPP